MATLRTPIVLTVGSNRPEELEALFENVYESVADPLNVGILLVADDGDKAVAEVARSWEGKVPTEVVYLKNQWGKCHLPLAKTFYLPHCHPDVYFLTALSDEVRFATKGWDEMLLAYRGHYSDDIFMVAVNKPASSAPTSLLDAYCHSENFPFITRRVIQNLAYWAPMPGIDSWVGMIFLLLSKMDIGHGIDTNRIVYRDLFKMTGIEPLDGIYYKGANKLAHDDYPHSTIFIPECLFDCVKIANRLAFSMVAEKRQIVDDVYIKETYKRSSLCRLADDRVIQKLPIILGVPSSSFINVQMLKPFEIMSLIRHFRATEPVVRRLPVAEQKQLQAIDNMPAFLNRHITYRAYQTPLEVEPTFSLSLLRPAWLWRHRGLFIARFLLHPPFIPWDSRIYQKARQFRLLVLCIIRRFNPFSKKGWRTPLN